MARGSWVPSELESRLSVWVVAEMMAQPGCLIGHRGVEARAGACRWQAPRSSRVDYVCTGLASTGERSPGREPRLGFRVRSTNERWVATWVARHRPGRDSNPGVQTAKINALLLRKRPETYRAGNYSATHKKSRWRAGSRSNPARLAREASFRAMWSADRHHVPRSPEGSEPPSRAELIRCRVLYDQCRTTWGVDSREMSSSMPTPRMPLSFFPQHQTVRSRRRAQAWLWPALSSTASVSV